MNPKRILFIQTAFLGDVVFSTALLAGIRKLYPGARITLLASPRGGDIMRRQPVVDEIILYDKKGRESGPASLARLITRLKRKRYDLVVSPHRSFRSALIVRLCGAPLRVGFRSGLAGMAYNMGVPYPRDENVPYLREMRLLRSLGGENADRARPLLHVGRESQRKARKRLACHGAGKDRPLVGFVPGTVWPTKRWPREHFLEAGRSLLDEGIDVAVFGGPSETEEASVFSPGEGFVNLTGETALEDLPSLISCCDALVAADTGPLHLAMALGVPVTALFGPTDERQFEFRDGDRCLTASVHCRPCSAHGAKRCPLGEWICMPGITAADAVDAVREIVTGGRGKKERDGTGGG